MKLGIWPGWSKQKSVLLTIFWPTWLKFYEYMKWVLFVGSTSHIFVCRSHFTVCGFSQVWRQKGRRCICGTFGRPERKSSALRRIVFLLPSLRSSEEGWRWRELLFPLLAHGCVVYLQFYKKNNLTISRKGTRFGTRSNVQNQCSSPGITSPRISVHRLSLANWYVL